MSHTATSGCSYPNMFVNQTPVYDRPMKKKTKKKKKGKKY